ncbi:MAG: tetratricopeptide repeat protein, partial [Gemmataceae bacterium]|nr:tetratricopeptide repeat protein [Gemmataceae bacterium]
RRLAARAARLSGDLPAAEAHLNRALEVAGGATHDIQVEFLLLRAQTGDLDRVAGPLLEAVEAGHPEAPLFLETLALGYTEKMRYWPAYGYLNKLVELRPDAARPYFLRGWVQERLNNHKGAMADYRAALDRDPELFPARLRVAEMLLEDKQTPDALPHLERLYRQNPDHPQVQARLGRCRMAQGDSAEARRLLEAAAPRLPTDPVVQIDLANLDLQEGRPADAERRLRPVLDRDPADTEAWYALAAAVRDQGRADEAAGVLKDYERAKADLDRVNHLLREVADSKTATAADYAEVGELLVKGKQERQGVYWLYQALEREPGNRRAHRALAGYYDRRGDASQAAVHRRRAGDDSP